MGLPENAESSGRLSQLMAEVESHRGYMLRFALAKLRDTEQANDVVQEALLAALESVEGFVGQSTLRTWLTSILNFKIIDLQRRVIRERALFSVSVMDDNPAESDCTDLMFDATGHWSPRLSAWTNPDLALEQKQFFGVFERCMDKLPASTRRVFFKREVIGIETGAICIEENISASNCWVILHRARLALRECLDQNWFHTARLDVSN